MSSPTEDALARALAALQYLQTPKTDPVSQAFWEQVQGALLDAQREREALLAVAQEAHALIEAIDNYDQAVAAEKADSVDVLGEACVEAEGALVDALYRLRALEDGDDEETRK